VGARGVVAAAQEGPQATGDPVAVQAPGSLTAERLPRRVRLARGSAVAACWEEGRRWRGRHLEFAWRPSPAGHLRFAVVVPRFQFTAVARNRLRRRLRELFRREFVAQLPVVDLVIRTKPSAYAASFSGLRAEVAGSVRRIV
jgi:ribonuclease P protein component